MAFLLIPVSNTFACVGRTLYIGAINNTEDQMMANLLVLFINARTGSTVKIRVFNDNKHLYQALRATDKDKRVDLVIEDTTDAGNILGIGQTADLEHNYIEEKKAYEHKFDAIWLDPFAFTNIKTGPKTLTASLVRRDIFISFPLLPRVLNKLAAAIDNQSFTELLDQTKKSKGINTAKTFLETRGLI